MIGACGLAVALIAILWGSTPMSAQKKPATISPPDTIYVNGKVWTGPKSESEVGPDSKMVQVPLDATVQAFAVRGDRIVAVGTNVEIKRLQGPKTQMVDLAGHFVMPGFNDAHLHLASGGFEKLNVNLTGAHSLDEMKHRIAERAATAHEGEWLTGRGWDHTTWPGKTLPTRQDIDAVTGTHPAIFSRVDGHIAVVNTAALKAAGITRETKDPMGGRFDRDAQGELTGIVREDSAMRDIYSKIPEPSQAQRRRAIELALQDAAQWGVTSAQDNSSWEDFLVYEELEREGKLTLRITEWLPFDTDLVLLKARRTHHAASDPLLHTGMLKGFMDGSLGSRTAALLVAYSDDPGNKGLPRYEQSRLNEMARQRVAAGFQLGFHAIGDAAAQMALDAFADAESNAVEHTGNSGDFRNRIEHLQVVDPGMLDRMARLGVIASVQPSHLLTDMNWAEDRIGPDRAALSYPLDAAKRAGVQLAFGTDYPVEPITPFRGVYSAVTRMNEAGTKSYYPEQKLEIAEALIAYTKGSAFAEFSEKEKGTIERGRLADFIVLDRDLLTVPPRQILGTKVLRTVVGGKTVWAR